MKKQSKLVSKIFELTQPKTLQIKEELLDLENLAPTELAAKTLFSAVSPGTEVAAYRGDPPLRPMKVYPRVVGYCNVAEVIAVGSAVKSYSVGDRILSFQSHRSSYVCAEQDVIARVPSSIGSAQAATTYLFHLGYNALLKGGFQPGLNVAVIGLGTLGLATVALTNAFGGRVFALSNQDSSLKLADELGAFGAVRKDQVDLRHKILQQTDQVGIDLVITTSGSWEDWSLAVSIARKEGTVAVLGFPGRTQPIPPFNPIDSQYFYDSQLRLIACGHSPDLDVPASDIRFTVKRNCKFLMDLISQGRLPADRLAAERVEWSKVGQAYDRLLQREAGLLTCILDWTI
jgi:threonine dehydrogenase-like Zn-dependent dehydrogenase